MIRGGQFASSDDKIGPYLSVMSWKEKISEDHRVTIFVVSRNFEVLYSC